MTNPFMDSVKLKTIEQGNTNSPTKSRTIGRSIFPKQPLEHIEEREEDSKEDEEGGDKSIAASSDVSAKIEQMESAKQIQSPTLGKSKK